MPWGVVAGAVIGGVASSSAASKAAKAQSQASDAAIGENARQYDQTRSDHMPYMDAGKRALGTLAAENDTPLDLSKITMDPGYEFARQQGQQAIDRQSAASGGRISGASLKAASQYNNNTATAGYSAAYGRANQARTDRLNRLAALAGVGQTATDNIGSLGAQSAANNSQIRQTQGNNAGASAMAQGNIWGNTANQLISAGMNLYGKSGSGSGSGGAVPVGGQSETDGMGSFW